MKNLQQLYRALSSRIGQRLSLLTSRVVINLVKAAGKMQVLQVEGLADEVLDEVEHFQDYGLASNPPAGSEGIMIAVAGVRSHGAVVAVVDRDSRLKGLLPGEVAVYDNQGQVVYLKRTGILIKSALRVDIEAPEVKVTGNAIVTGNATVQGNATVEGNATVNGTTVAKGQVKLGGENPTKFVMLADGTPSTQVKAL